MNNRSTHSAAFPGILFFAFFTLYGLTMPGVPLRGDPEAMFLVARGLATDGSAALDKNPVIALVPGRGGRYYAKFGIAQSLIEAPFIAAGRAVSGKNAAPDYRYYLDYFASSWAAPLVSALSAVLLYLIILNLGFGFASAAGLSVVFGLCTMAWPYAGSGFSEPLQVCLVLVGMYGVLRSGGARRTGGAIAWAAAAGAAAGALVLAKSVLAVLAPLMGGYLFWTLWVQDQRRKASRSREKRVQARRKVRRASPRFSLVILGAVVFCLAAVPGAAGALYYNFYRFGSALNFGYNTSHDAWFGFSTPLLTGLYGLLFSPGKSVFFYNPVLVLGLMGARAFHRERPRESIFIWGVCAALLLVYARWWAWHGDWSWGPRFLLPCAALALLPAAALPRGAKPALKLAAAAMISLSLCVQILGAFVNHSEYIYYVTRRIPQHPFYVSSPAQERNLRDAGLTAHFVPEFSPLAGHAWIFSGIVQTKLNPSMDAGAELARTAPWRSLIRLPASGAPPPDPNFAFWHAYLPRAGFFPHTRAWVLPLRNSMAVACVLLWLVLFLKYRTMTIRLRTENGGHAD